MNIRIHKLALLTKRETEVVDFESDVTFIHGPISQGKSTAARLIDYCLGGSVERTPALRSEFVAAQAVASLGAYSVTFERGATENSPVRVTWVNSSGSSGALNAPLDAGDAPILGDDVYNLSDLIFYFCGVAPIKVRRSKADPESPVVRLSFRDLMWYCFLHQNELDSSFFELGVPFKSNKSRDAMRFVTGLFSERLSELEAKLSALQQQQRAKREAVEQITGFMAQFGLASQAEFEANKLSNEQELAEAVSALERLDRDHQTKTHAIEPLREELRMLAARSQDIRTAIAALNGRIEQQESLRSELITTKVKSARAQHASTVLGQISFEHCPQCGTTLDSTRFVDPTHCRLCGQVPKPESSAFLEIEDGWGRDLDLRIDELKEALGRHKRELSRQEQQLVSVESRRSLVDRQLSSEVSRYDSAYTSAVRAAEGKVNRLRERLASLSKFAAMPTALAKLQCEADELHPTIETVKRDIQLEYERLKEADTNIAAIAEEFKRVMLAVGFPGVYPDDRVHLDSRNWLPFVSHQGQEWSFFDAGSGGKKTLFNVCYALAVHRVALERDLPLPSFLIIDSPIKNITRDENEALVDSLFENIYALANACSPPLQLILIDSHLVAPETEHRFSFRERRMVPPLISYYSGP